MARRKKRDPFALGPMGSFGMNSLNMPSNNQRSSLSQYMPKSSSNDGGDPFDALVGAGKIAIDVISAPSRAAGGLIDESKKDGFSPLDIPRGLGKAFDENYDPSDVIDTPISNKGVPGFLEDLALDVVFDPLTYASLGVGAVLKTGAKVGAKGIGAAAGAKAGKKATEKTLEKEIKNDIIGGVKDARKSLSGKQKELEGLKRDRDFLPQGSRAKRDLAKKIDQYKASSKKANKEADKIEKSIAPGFLSTVKKKIDDIKQTSIKERQAALNIAQAIRQAAQRRINDLDAKPTAKDLGESLRKQDKEIAALESKRSATKVRSPERADLNKKLFEARQGRKKTESQFANANKEITKDVAAREAAQKAIQQADELEQAALKNTISGKPIRAMQGYKAVAQEIDDFNKLLPETSRQIDNFRQLDESLDVARKENLSPDQLASKAEEAAQLRRQAADQDELARQADRSLYRDPAPLDKQIKQLDDEVADLADEVAGFEEQLRILASSDNVEEFFRRAEKIRNLVDGPAMRDVAPDLVQRRLKFAPMGINIPGISDTLSIGLGKAYSKSAKRAKFDARFPRLAKARNLVGETFNPIYNISPYLADLERGRSNLARADADRLISHGMRLGAKIAPEEKSIINRMLVEADDLGMDISSQQSRDLLRGGRDIDDLAATSTAKNAQKMLDEGAQLQARRLEILDQFDSLSDEGKEAVEFVLQTYRKDAEIDFFMGFIKTVKEGYSSRHRPLKNDEQPIITRANEGQLYQDQGFTKSRTGATPEEEIDFLQAFSMRQAQAAQMRHGFAMVKSLNQEFGKKFSDEAAAEAAGYIKPSAGKAGEWLGKDNYIPKEIADSLDRLNEIWTSPRVLNAFTRKWSILNGQFKNLAYSVNLGHLTIDAIGDTWNMWLSKVPIFDPKYGPRAITLLNKINSYDKAVSKGLTPEVSTVKLGNREVDLEELIIMMDAKGQRNRGRSANRSGQIDNEAGDYFFGSPTKRFSPRKGLRAISDKTQNIGNWRDNTHRSYGLLVQLQKNLDDGMDYALALNSAGNTIRFSTFDYNDLTSIEKRLFRNVMPFYTWTRKNIPYQLNRLMETPGRVILPFKAQEALLQQEDAPDKSLLQSFTRDSNFFIPSSISEKIPVLGGASLFMNPMIPSMDLGRFQTYRVEGEDGPVPGVDFMEGIGMLSPYIKAVPELGFNREFFSGREIGSPTSYAMRTFLGQPGGQVVRQLAPNTSGSEEFGPINMTRRQIIGLSGQLLGIRGTALEESPAYAARSARMQSIAMRKSAKESAKQEAGSLFRLPLFGTDVPNPFYY